MNSLRGTKLKRALLTFGVLIFESLLLVTDINAESRREVIVSAAMSLKSAFEEIGKVFEKKQKGVKIVFNFGPSGGLQRQIEAGAPVDVFASASINEMDELYRKGLIMKNTMFNFTGNTIVLISPSNSGIQFKSFNDLQKGEVKRIAIGNPLTVPAGRYSEEVLRNIKLWDVLKDKFVFTENVRQVLDYVARGEVDAGMVYATDVMLRSKEVKIVTQAPDGSHKPVVYPIAVVKGTKNEVLAREFIVLVTSDYGKEILKKHGFERVRLKRH